MKINVTFKAEATITVPDEVIKQYANELGIDLESNPSLRRIMIQEYVKEFFYVQKYYTDYSGSKSFVQVVNAVDDSRVSIDHDAFESDSFIEISEA